MWDLFLMKKLIKNKICGSMNSAYMHDSLQKVNICGYCSLNSNRNTPKCVKTKKKKKKEQNAAWKRRLEIQTHTNFQKKNVCDGIMPIKNKIPKIPFSVFLILVLIF